jgi:hypothetical protein
MARLVDLCPLYASEPAESWTHYLDLMAVAMAEGTIPKLAFLLQ